MKKQRHHFVDKVSIVRAMVFPVVIYRHIQSYTVIYGHIQTELNHREGLAPRNWCFWIVVLEKILESPWYSKEIKPVNPKGNQPWIFIGRTDAEAEALMLWPPDMKSWLIGKDPDVGKDWGQAEKGMTEDEMVGWCHWLNGHESEQTCCSPWGLKELDTT